MTVREQVMQVLDGLSEGEFEEVAEYLAFLKFKSRLYPQPVFDANEVAALYAEAAEEDRYLAEAGMAEYNANLLKEDDL